MDDNTKQIDFTIEELEQIYYLSLRESEYLEVWRSENRISPENEEINYKIYWLDSIVDKISKIRDFSNTTAKAEH